LDRIREFKRTDIEQVAHLHRDVFGLTIEEPERHYGYFSEQFLSSGADSLPSLVAESSEGRIIGFLGVAVRHFTFEDRRITAGLSSQFVVHPEGRRRLTGVHLLREFLRGPQDLSFTDEANDTSERIWVALGGSVSNLQTIHWVIPLRPIRLAFSRAVPAWMSAAFGGAANLLDQLVSRLPHSPFREREVELQGEPLSTETMLACLDEITPQCQLRPRYEWESLDGLLESAGRKRDGLLRGILLRDPANRVAGWYLCHCVEGGLAEVLQIASRSDCQGQVVAHLSADARTQGAIAVVGRLEPGLAEPLANQLCFLFRRKSLMLVHSRHPEIVSAIHSGHAFISRLEGEWCVRFVA
jgi:hypothetical protein